MIGCAFLGSPLCYFGSIWMRLLGRVWLFPLLCMFIHCYMPWSLGWLYEVGYGCGYGTCEAFWWFGWGNVLQIKVVRELALTYLSLPTRTSLHPHAPFSTQTMVFAWLQRFFRRGKKKPAVCDMASSHPHQREIIDSNHSNENQKPDKAPEAKTVGLRVIVTDMPQEYPAMPAPNDEDPPGWSHFRTTAAIQDQTKALASPNEESSQQLPSGTIVDVAAPVKVSPEQQLDVLRAMLEDETLEDYGCQIRSLIHRYEEGSLKMNPEGTRIGVTNGVVLDLGRGIVLG